MKENEEKNEEKSTFSHIRKMVPFTGELSSMTLDAYTKKHVKRTSPPSPWLRNFKRTHYFGPAYWTRKSPAFLEQTHRVNNFQRNIREVKGMIDFKVQMKSQQRMLEQLKIDMAQEKKDPPPSAVAVDGDVEMEDADPKPEPLVLMIGDEILYDEEYKFDPIWRQET